MNTTPPRSSDDVSTGGSLSVSPFVIKGARTTPPMPQPKPVESVPAIAAETIPPIMADGTVSRRPVAPPMETRESSRPTLSEPKTLPAARGRPWLLVISGVLIIGLGAAGVGFFLSPTRPLNPMTEKPPVLSAPEKTESPLALATAARDHTATLIVTLKDGRVPSGGEAEWAAVLAGDAGAKHRFMAGELDQARALWDESGRKAGRLLVTRARNELARAAGKMSLEKLVTYAPGPAAAMESLRTEAETVAATDPLRAIALYKQVEDALPEARRAAAEQLRRLGTEAAQGNDRRMALLFYGELLSLAPDDEAAIEYLHQHAYAAGETLVAPGGLRFAYVPPGRYTRGTPAMELGRDIDEPLHQVALTRGFFMSVFEVTQAQWDTVHGPGQSARRLRTAKLGEEFIGGDKPMINVTWDEAVAFCRTLGEREGVTYRLPTEAEWEYACRAGTTTPFHTGVGLSSREANIDDGSRDALMRTAPVGTIGAANPWGLFDLHGNVWEWCADWSAPYPKTPVSNPSGPADAGRVDLAMKVVRGGSWNDGANEARSGNRWEYSPVVQTSYIGFRIVREPSFSTQP